MFVRGGRGDNLGSIMYDLNEKFEKTVYNLLQSKKQINCLQSVNGFIKAKMSTWLSKFVICSLGEAGRMAWKI